jgi:phosphate:Na+ symporter
MNTELTQIVIDALVFKAVGGLGIFLLGLKFMSDGMQVVAGNRLRHMIGAVTNNRIAACTIGTLVTCVVQSSSVTTVMVVGFVNGGFMTLMQALGVVIGANIGTTITGWILALKIGKYGLPILGVSALAYLFVKNERVRYSAMTICGVGMIFFGLQTMSSGFKNPEVNKLLLDLFATMSGETILAVAKCAVIGALATMVVQSSSATLGVTIALAQAGIIGFHTAAALILGLNIGTTITAFLASLGTTVNAKRAAYAHIIFNVLGTLWLLPIFFWYTSFVELALSTFGGFFSMDPGIVSKIALMHSSFNIVNTIAFLPFLTPFANLVTRLVPDKGHKETPHLNFLDVRLLESPAMGIAQSHDEIVRMGTHVGKMSSMVRQSLASDRIDENNTRRIFHREEILDIVQDEVTKFLSHILSGNISSDIVAAGREQLRMADEYESVSDYYAKILKLNLKRIKNDIDFTEGGREDILALHDKVDEHLRLVSDAVSTERVEVLSKARIQGDAIVAFVKESRRRHLAQVGSRNANPRSTLIFTDMLNSYRRVKDHMLNVAEALAGEK